MDKLELLLLELDWLMQYIEGQAIMDAADRQVLTESLSFLYSTFSQVSEFEDKPDNGDNEEEDFMNEMREHSHTDNYTENEDMLDDEFDEQTSQQY